ncbi:hypothetical protein [Halorarius halobius]|uniref:hypothetical protein n=1 Tax=Halorarius halobius TaxID=2962671 RepID=UPI0020CE1423|nr:hypothetical protein [Halorarius halobius]
MSETESDPPIACEMTAEMAADRPGLVHDALADAYAGAEEHEDGVTLRFEGTEAALEAAATFVVHEHQCCAFADYRIEVSPPYETTSLTITGPEGVKQMFLDGMVPLLESATE